MNSDAFVIVLFLSFTACSMFITDLPYSFTKNMYIFGYCYMYSFSMREKQTSHLTIFSDHFLPTISLKADRFVN